MRRKGGRFLAYNAHKKIFFSDIGDKKATEKTSQALRDAKRKIAPVDIPTPQVNRAKELSNELYFRYTCQVLQSLHVQDQDGCHAHSFPTVTDNIGAAPKYERDSLISERDTAISSISIGVKINKDLEHHDTRMTSSELCIELGLVDDNDVEMTSTEHCQKLIDGNNIGGLVDDNDVEMISTEHAHGGTHASSATTLTPQLTSVAARGLWMSKALEEDTMTSTSYQAMLFADVRYQDVAFGNAVAIQLNESYGTNHLQVQDDSMIFAFGEDASSSNYM